MEYPANIILLLLQIILQRQQFLVHHDKSLVLDTLLEEPIIDRAVMTEFQTHKLVKMYAPELETLQLRNFKNLVNELFEKGLPDDKDRGEEAVTVVSLANYYYKQRIEEIEYTHLPALRDSIIDCLQNYS